MAAELNTVDALAQLSFLVQGTLEQRASEHGLSIIQTRLLGVLRDRRPTINELATLLELDKSSVSGLVDRAERRGMVERVPSTADRRAVQVRLTARGRSVVAKAEAQFGAEIMQLLESLSVKERDTLVRLITKVLIAHASSHGVDLLDTDAR